jgi:hypothetical protein
MYLNVFFFKKVNILWKLIGIPFKLYGMEYKKDPKTGFMCEQVWNMLI